jgi:tetratricopeptide (TPR) repeat protein
MSYHLVQPESILKKLNLEREYVRSSLLSRRKKRYYFNVMTWLTEYEPEPSASNTEKLKGYLEAFLALCDVGDFERAKALLLLTIDGKKTLHEYFGKLGCYTEQCQLYEPLLDRIDKTFNCILLNGLGWAYGRLGKTERALLLHQQELEVAQKLSDPLLEAKAYEGLGQIYSLSLHQPTEAIYCYEKMLEIATKINDYKQQALALVGKGYSKSILGKFNEQIDLCHQALKLAKTIKDEDTLMQVLTDLGGSYIELGRYKLAIEILEDQLEKSQALNERRRISAILLNLGIAYLSLSSRKYPIVIEYISEALGIATEIQDSQLQYICLQWLGVVYARVGIFDQSLENLFLVYQKLLSYDERLLDRAICLSNIAYCYGCKKDFNLAINYADRALGIAKQLKNKQAQSFAIAVIANAHWQQGRYLVGIVIVIKSFLIYPPWQSNSARFTFRKTLEEVGGLLLRILKVN